MEAPWSPPTVPRRLPGWERSFVEVLDAHLARPFAWGLSDCLILPAELCLHMTGADVFPRPMRTQRSSESAAALLSELGLSGVEDALKRVFPPIAKARARRGDCGVREVLIAGVPIVSTFIVLGNGMAVGKAEGRNRVVVPVFELSATFAIGEPG